MNDGSISPELYTFFAAYFHQDWDLEAEDWEGVVDNYVDADPVSAPLRELASEIDNLRAARSEEDLRTFLLKTVGVSYLPDPLTFKQWLDQIAAHLRDRASEIEHSNEA
ncbi:contact-dependent growth inhibition system immunity protein [Mycolicibacterium tokaiense]|uniref:CdiI immunity protein domain-containing protein n=1 Tax=Mycolicibacterium tokaiense TaxID=39695 RepID=A0A378T986_9MYCO|nr:contact-dependent growth inhibition system immunity protein [Mycolicibacterium tokaiense]BBY88085.1 hypothetical protein MTOK_38670 [Mycolicibacterium tokaiense]STZ57392.1 Uncharacterised protein [Mycolicibacterium tokaiense]